MVDEGPSEPCARHGTSVGPRDTWSSGAAACGLTSVRDQESIVPVLVNRSRRRPRLSELWSESRRGKCVASRLRG
jgi:hypothetical protein